jgi:hypothetical protein
MFNPRIDWAGSFRALGKIVLFVPQLFRKKDKSGDELVQGAHASANLSNPGAVTTPARHGDGNDDHDLDTVHFTPPASIDQTLIHPALRNLEAKISRRSEDACSDTDSAIDVSSCRSSLECQTSPQCTFATFSEGPCKDVDPPSARASLAGCCHRLHGSNCNEQLEEAAFAQHQHSLEDPQKADNEPISLEAFERRMTIARVVARNKYTHTEILQREFCWDDEFYTDQTGHLGILQEEMNTIHRKAIQTCPTGYRLRTCSWHKLKTPFGKRGPQNAANGSVPQIKLTNPEGKDWFLEDMRYYPDEEKEKGATNKDSLGAVGKDSSDAVDEDTSDEEPLC